MENKNQKLNSFKFTSAYLSRPFTSQQEHREQKEIKEEIPDFDIEVEQNNNFNMTNYNNNKNNFNDKDYSLSNIKKYNDSYSNNSNSIFPPLYNNNIITNNNNLNISSSTINSKKRKPFDKLSFHSNNSEKLNDNNLIDESNTNLITNNNSSTINDDNNINNVTSSSFNKSQISNDEKNMILSCYNLLSKETLEKAKKFNSNYKNSTPFWIKFFEEIQNDNLNSNSSYFKYNNKNEYVKSLIEMVQRDADIYDEINLNKQKKEETQNSIKLLIQESNNQSQVNETNNSKLNNESQVSNNNKSNMTKNKSKVNVKNNEENKNDIELNNKLQQILAQYNKIEQKDKKFYSKEIDYDSFKFKLLTGGKFNSDNQEKNIPEVIKKLENLEDIEENKEDQKEEDKKKYDNLKVKKPTQKIENNKEVEYKTIDTLYFGDDYTFEELNYDKIDFHVYNKDSIKKLLHLDKKLHEIDPERYNTSINTELKKIQDEFNKGKKERYLKIEKETREKFNKYLSELDKKVTIFDIKPKDETKKVYKDYLKEQTEQKNKRIEIQKKLNNLDNKIKDIYNNEIPESKKNELKQKLENYHKTEEYKQKFENTPMPGLSQLKQINKELKEFEENNKILMNDLKEIERLIEEEKKKPKINKIEEEEKFKKEIIEPFQEYQKEIKNIEEDNKEKNEKIKNLEKNNQKEEEYLENIKKKLNDIEKDKNNYDKIFEEADKILEENQNNENELKQEINNIINIGTDEELIEKYGINELKEQGKKNEEEINEINKMIDNMGKKLNEIKKNNDEIEMLKDKKFEDLGIMPKSVKEFLEEMEREKNIENDTNNNENNNIENNNIENNNNNNENNNIDNNKIENNNNINNNNVNNENNNDNENNNKNINEEKENNLNNNNQLNDSLENNENNNNID